MAPTEGGGGRNSYRSLLIIASFDIQRAKNGLKALTDILM